MRRTGGTVAAVIGLIAAGAPALACSPAPGFTFEKAFNEASLVFRGVVVEARLNDFVDPRYATETDPKGHGDPKGRNVLDVRYELLETFKGAPAAKGTVSTNTEIMGGCGLPVLPGWQFLFVVKPFEPDVPKDVSAGSQGYVSIISSNMLPPDKAALDEELADVRALAGKK